MRKPSKTTTIIIIAVAILATCIGIIAQQLTSYDFNAPVETRQVVLEDLNGNPLTSPYDFQQAVYENATIQVRVHNIGNVSALVGLTVSYNSGVTVSLDTYSVTLLPDGSQHITMSFTNIDPYYSSVSWGIELYY